MTTQGMADYMYQNCLSIGVRREMSDVREDYDKLKKRLLEAYGDPTRIIATERRLLFKIKKPDENDGESVLTFLDEVLARMNTMVKVVEDHKGRYPHLPGVVYSDETLIKIKESLSTQIRIKFESKFRKWRVDAEDEMRDGDRDGVTKEEEFKKCKDILRKLRGKQKLALLEDLDKIPEKGKGKQMTK